MRDRFETERLLLRPLEQRDAAAIHRHCQDGSIARFTAHIPAPYPVLAVELYILSVRAGAGNRNRFAYAVTGKDDDRLVGACGIFKRNAAATHWEIGYWVGPEAQGRGIASEAAAGLVEAARADLAPDRLVAGHFEDNPASGRVLEKLGFAYTGETTRLFSMGRMAYATSRDMALAV
ncbi:GNAT family N-acetyltransferase [Hyphobacterium sp.]|uniref:GNAT family N-acetyltransferase n=1 Tax=Hyphobacterium sp. TaxID=2004662 RepID=UPI003B52C8CE